MTSLIALEWKTRSARLISSSTKGKKDRTALAATEKANVCTSVRIKYLTVERIRLGEGRLRRKAGLGAAGEAGVEAAGVGGVTTSN